MTAIGNTTVKELLTAIKEYIEEAEVYRDTHHDGRGVEQLIADDLMPDVYSEVVELLEVIK